jgi:hypothetical protein
MGRPSATRYQLRQGRGRENRVKTIDISWLDWAYKSSTCDVMYCRHSAPPFILWWSNLEILFAPPPARSSPFIGKGMRCQAIQMEHGSYIRENTKCSLYCEMSVIKTVLEIIWTVRGDRRRLAINLGRAERQWERENRIL